MRSVTTATARVDVASEHAAIQFDCCSRHAPNPGVQNGLCAISNPRRVSTPQPQSFLRMTIDRDRHTLIHADHAGTNNNAPFLTTIRSPSTP